MRENKSMSVNQDQLDHFHQFATDRINRGEAVSLEDLVADWSGAELSEEDLTRNAATIQKAVDDMDAGDTGRPAREVLGELRTKHGLPQG
jgi:hypothetical protein